MAAHHVRRGMGRADVAGRVRRPRSVGDLGGSIQQRAVPLRRHERGVHGRSRHGRADDHGARHRRAEAALPRTDAPGRRALVPAVLRTGRRFRSGQPGHPGRARRRRMGDQRPEGLELDGTGCGLGHSAGPDRSGCAQTQGHHLLPRRHAHIGNRCPAAAPDHDSGPLQRGLPRRRPHSRGQRVGFCQRRLAGHPDNADERARRDRRLDDGADVW